MKIMIGLGLAALAAGTAGASPPGRGADDRLARAIGNRTAESPVDCVMERDLQDNQAEHGTIVFRTRSNALVYVNRPPGSCPYLNRDRAIRIRTISDRLCRGDIVEVFDPVSRVEFGACGLGDFTPYRRAPR